ncbi:DUF3461 family protein [Paracoccus sp. M683]|uniref:DUF3461 family protein n=1 Tax=Paracoccus sp. M683 TaxID=2594268 RepID=UPI00117D65BE|nr:DUF3461 family protein [Paracoccus sp. M683]TRW98115.1 DUF3461 family protein [Paracoccus sp. M683]
MYPTLTQMGITSPGEISSYDYFQDANDEDILRIKYRRRPGSFLPETRVYRFRRIGVAEAGGGTEISPTLSDAIVELDELLATKGEVLSLAAQIEDAVAAAEMELARVRALTRKITQTTSG